MTPAELVAKYRSKGILLDTNLLILLVMGLYRPDRILTFSRTRQYTPRDFDLVLELVSRFQKWIVTPHIFAEADNLARQLPRSEHRELAIVMSKFIAITFEVYCPSVEAAQHERYQELGLTDCTILAASSDALVLTDDFRLSNILAHLGRDAININHIRTFD